MWLKILLIYFFKIIKHLSNDDISNSNYFDYVDFCTENELRNNANYKAKSSYNEMKLKIL